MWRCNVSKNPHLLIILFQISDPEIKATWKWENVHYNSTAASPHILSHAIQAWVQ